MELIKGFRIRVTFCGHLIGKTIGKYIWCRPPDIRRVQDLTSAKTKGDIGTILEWQKHVG